MVAIRYNRPASLTLKFVGGTGRIDLNPGVTIGVSASDWEHAKRHPIVKLLMASGELEPLLEAPAVSDLQVKEGEHSATYSVTEDAKTGQPMPVMASKTSVPDEEPPAHVAVSPPAIAPALALLNGEVNKMTDLPTIGLKSATIIFGNRPEHGYVSVNQAIAKNAELNRIDWDAVKDWQP